MLIYLLPYDTVFILAIYKLYIKSNIITFELNFIVYEQMNTVVVLLFTQCAMYFV